jgi:5-methylcytosine-specific restriction endonuclease McrA
MAHEYAQPFYNSRAWQSCRASYIANRIKIDGGLCEACHERIGFIVHHKVMIDETNINDVNITLSHDNLQYVCKYCHDRMDNHFVRNKRGPKIKVLFDENGQPIVPIPEK